MLNFLVVPSPVRVNRDTAEHYSDSNAAVSRLNIHYLVRMQKCIVAQRVSDSRTAESYLGVLSFDRYQRSAVPSSVARLELTVPRRRARAARSPLPADSQETRRLLIRSSSFGLYRDFPRRTRCSTRFVVLLSPALIHFGPLPRRSSFRRINRLPCFVFSRRVSAVYCFPLSLGVISRSLSSVSRHYFIFSSPSMFICSPQLRRYLRIAVISLPPLFYFSSFYI